MNEEKIIKVIDYVIVCLNELKGILKPQEVTPNPKIEEEVIELVEEVPEDNLSVLARRLAYSYFTKHPEYKIDTLFKDLQTMVGNGKFSYVLNWLRKTNIEGLDDFFLLNDDDKRELAKQALSNHESEVKDIFKQRFKHDS